MGKSLAERIRLFNHEVKRSGVLKEWRLAFRGPAKASSKQRAKRHRHQIRVEKEMRKIAKRSLIEHSKSRWVSSVRS